MSLKDNIRRSGPSEPYPDAVAVKAAIEALELKTINYRIDATDLAAGTAQNFIAPCDGHLVELAEIAQVAIVTGGAITVEINTVAVTGLSITVPDGQTVGTRLTDTVDPAVNNQVKKGDRITITPAAAFNGGGAVNGYFGIRQT